MFKRLCSIAIIFGVAALVPLTHVQTMTCLPRADLIEHLEERYSEHLAGGGLQSAQQLLEIWASDQTGSFTVFVTRPDGLSCVIATGQNWQDAAPTHPEGVAG
ncbi:hypothetical protein [uncultured Roseovarius sp.]|uniref:hypothetical protein n=1 Tax=uncultured Roseovarius sp. TaxID=293344 RepID=UPI000C649B7E|nr:hypothetical protein [Roseovarius sp.]MBD11308.1 hypothetical protein [Roseovarius sp.]|tara:strand:+ start:791 stop:1099 length:309 start_codon:yes stop_codon:yes gene_type:complete